MDIHITPEEEDIWGGRRPLQAGHLRGAGGVLKTRWFEKLKNKLDRIRRTAIIRVVTFLSIQGKNPRPNL
jgi:hypothetical protein